MILIVAAFLAGKAVLPQIDRNALDLQARAEALQPRARPARPVRRPVTRRASGGSPLDLAAITTICRAAGDQADPAAFISRLSTAYSLSPDDSGSLRSSCAAYLAGRADARRTSN
ncbi:MAG TPA: hypothetical protein VES64_06465 [Allosphingosinicella sp.]|nr:hypothetical protein [Allosphingosinicella sp.]